MKPSRMKHRFVKILPWYYTFKNPKSRKDDIMLTINYEKEADRDDD